MDTLTLHTTTKNQLVSILKTKAPVSIIIDGKIDTSFLELLNTANTNQKIITVTIFLGKDVSLSILEHLPNIQHIRIYPSYEVQLTTLDVLQHFSQLKTLEISPDYTKKNISLKPIEHITSLVKFSCGSLSKNQYAFLNQQKNLEYLEMNSINMDFASRQKKLHTLRIHNNIQSAQYIPEKFPNIKQIHLHGCSRLTDFNFLQNVEKITDVYIGYNSHITELPKMKKPKLVKTIELHSCPNISSLKNIVACENLEKFTLTSHDKPLQLSIQEFKKLIPLKKLTTVYTVWGNRPQKEVDTIDEIYKKMNWKNTGLTK